MKMNIHLLGLLAILFSLIFSGCGKDEDEGGSSTFKINGTPSYASTLGDFLNGEFLGANFSDKSKLDVSDRSTPYCRIEYSFEMS